MFGSVAAFASNTTLGCNLFSWMLPVGFALLFGYVKTVRSIIINTFYIFSRSLFAKTARIYLLFSNKSLQIVKYTDRDVGFGVGIVLVAEVVVVATMTALQPPQFAYQNEDDLEFSFCLFHQSTGITLLAFNVSCPKIFRTKEKSPSNFFPLG